MIYINFLITTFNSKIINYGIKPAKVNKWNIFLFFTNSVLKC